MFFDTNIFTYGIDEDFLEELDEFIEDSRVEYFLINPKSKDEIEVVQNLCEKINRFKYVLPCEFLDLKDDNCVAVALSKIESLESIEDFPIVVSSNNLSDELKEILNRKKITGLVLDAKESDNDLENFVFSISHNSIGQWTQLGMKNTDYNKLALQSEYPKHSYDDYFDLLKEVSDMTFRAEQSIASGSTRTLLKMFGLL